MPEEGLRTLSASIVGSRGNPVQVPPSLRGLPGDLTILLADSNFVSFAGPFDPGRPAPCRPDTFWSAEPKLFPLTDEEKRQLRAMYPADWKPRAP